MAARVTGRLTALAVAKAKKPGLYPDGGNLYLQVTSATARSWIFRYRPPGKKIARELGLGSLATVTLADARNGARDARALMKAGRDPIGVLGKRATAAKAKLDAAHTMTFKACAEAYVEAHRDGWRNRKHVAQWGSTLETYAYPIIGDLPVQSVDVALVLKILSPIWKKKPETASRVRGRIESILDWARVRGFRSGENPSRWRGNLDHLLPARRKVRAVKHHAALPFDDMGAFMTELRKQGGVAARGLEFLILTAGRTSEVTGALRAEVDRAKALWIVPSNRIKAGKEHRVPLSPRALEILDELAPLGGDHLFPGGRKGKPLSENAFLALLRRMGRDDITAHGFRSTFRDWCSERTAYPAEVAEMALAHAVGDKVEAAYRRGDLLEKRVRLMADWETFCSAPPSPAQVVPIGSKQRVKVEAR